MFKPYFTSSLFLPGTLIMPEMVPINALSALIFTMRHFFAAA